MTRRLTMCDNVSCEDYHRQRTVMGGCEFCGSALVPYKTEDELTSEALWKLTPQPVKTAVGLALLARLREENE